MTARPSFSATSWIAFMPMPSRATLKVWISTGMHWLSSTLTSTLSEAGLSTKTLGRSRSKERKTARRYGQTQEMERARKHTRPCTSNGMRLRLTEEILTKSLSRFQVTTANTGLVTTVPSSKACTYTWALHLAWCSLRRQPLRPRPAALAASAMASSPVSAQQLPFAVWLRTVWALASRAPLRTHSFAFERSSQQE